MEKWRNITIIISIIVGIAIGLCFYNLSPLINDVKNDPVTLENVNYLKECISKVAKTLNTEEIKDPNVKIYENIYSKTLNITAKLMRGDSSRYTVIAFYPLLVEDDVNVDNEFINLKAKVDYDNVRYSEKDNDADILLTGQLLAIMLTTICGVGVYYLLYKIPEKIREKKKK